MSTLISVITVVLLFTSFQNLRACEGSLDQNSVAEEPQTPEEIRSKIKKLKRWLSKNKEGSYLEDDHTGGPTFEARADFVSKRAQRNRLVKKLKAMKEESSNGE